MKKAALVVLAVMILSLAQVAMAQVTATSPIKAIKAESLTIATTQLADFTITGMNAPAQTVTVTTTWNLMPTRATVDICAGSTDLAPSLAAGNPDSIPADLIQARLTSGGTWAAINSGSGCNQASGVLNLRTYTLDKDTRKSQTVANNVDVRIVGIPADLQADTYTGTFTVYAYVQ